MRSRHSVSDSWLSARKTERGKPVDYVRIVGGLREHLRFLHTVDPAITRKRDISGQAVKSTAKLQRRQRRALGQSDALLSTLQQGLRISSPTAS